MIISFILMWLVKGQAVIQCWKVVRVKKTTEKKKQRSM